MNYGEAFANLNRRIFLGLDQETLRREVLARLAARYPDVRINQVMEAIIDVATYGVPAVGFHVDRGATEACFATATLADSVSRLARALYGYKASGAGAAAVDCTVAPASAQAFAFTLPAGHAFSGPRGTKWLLADALSWAADETAAKDCTLIQHELFQVSARGTGLAGQEIVLGSSSARKPLQDGSVVVYVNGSPWTEVDALTPDLAVAQTQFEVDALRTPARVRFGDGVAGTIPDAGVPITVEYAVTMAEKGGIVAADVLKADKLIVSGHAVSFTTTHAGSSGGTAPESLEQIRRTAPRHRTTAGRAITSADYTALAEGYVSPQYGSVAAAAVVDGRYLDPGSASLLEEIRGAIDQQATVIGAEIDRITAALAVISGLVANAVDTLYYNVNAGIGFNTSVTAKLNSIGVYGASASSELTLLSRALTNATTGNNDSMGRAATIKERCDLIPGQLQLIATLVRGSAASADVKSAVADAIAHALNSAGIIGSNAAVLSNAYAAISNAVAAASGSTAIVQGAVDNTLVVVDEAKAQLVSSSSFLAKALVQNDAIAAQVAVITAAAAAISAKFIDLEPRIVDITNRLGTYLEGALLGHEANIVSVSLLCLDSDGYYAAPTNGLIRSIETHLTGRSAPNVLVRAVSGVPNLIHPTIKITFLETPNGVPMRIATEMASLLAARLRQRPAGEGIVLNELYKLVDREVEFVKWFAVLITHPEEMIDASGNLVIAAHQFVTLGVIEIRHWLTPTTSEVLVLQ